MKIALYASAFLVLAGCETAPRPGDTTGPAFTVLHSARGLPVVHVSDPDATRLPEVRTCPDGSSPYGSQDPAAAARVTYVLPSGETRPKLLYSFVDVSGIRSARLTVPVRSASSPDPALPIESLPTHGGGTADFHVWDFAETGPLRTPKLFELTFTVAASLTGAPVQLSAVDGAGNRSATVFFVAPQAAVCR